MSAPDQPFAPPVVPHPATVGRGRGGPRTRTLAIVLFVLVAAAAIAVSVIRSCGVPRGPDGTVYIETNSAHPGTNSILAFKYHEGSFRPLEVEEYPTNGSGSADLDNAGVLDADNQVITNPQGTLLFAINQGSDTVAVFRIKGDGSLEPSPGSPYPSGGTAPGALGLSGNILVVANKAQDGVRDLKRVEANYTTFRVGADGALTRTGFTQTVPVKSSPTQVFVAPGGDQVFTTEETGVLRGYRLGTNGQLTPAPDNPVKLGPEVFDRGSPPKVIWPAGLSADLDDPVLYTGIPNYSSIAAYDYEDNGDLKFASTVHDTRSFLPCWSIVNEESDRLYFANAGSGNISVFDIGEDPRHPKLMQTVELPGGGNPWNLQLDPTGDYLYIMTPRQVKEIPRGDGQLLHSLRVQSDGTLTEMPDSPVPMPVAVDSNPLGLAVVARR